MYNLLVGVQGIIRMIEIKIASNDAEQRLDRFLRKYLKRAPLSAVYKIIRKDLKLNGKRAAKDVMLAEGDVITLYMTEDKLKELTAPAQKRKAKRQFKIAYEDRNVLIVEKPSGLLTHGDSHEKKNTLMNQVCGYLQEKGEYDPAREKTFTPSPVNRLDRNTTGLVIFGKTAEGLRQLTSLIREREGVSKYYVTIVAGNLKDEIVIDDPLEKNDRTNTVRISRKGQEARTVVRPVEHSRDGRYSAVEIELVTGRTHQIRAHLAGKGYPLIGDPKYGIRYPGVNTQLLHAHRLVFGDIPEEYTALSGLRDLEVKASVPREFEHIWKKINA